MPFSRQALLTPELDALCAGGASLVLVALLLAVGPIPSLVALSVLVNWPHFMASYRLLYATPGAARKHPFAAVYVPAALVVLAASAAALYTREPLLFYGFHAAAAIYLAWHYTGQAWGTMSAFARLEGLRLDAAPRRLLRANIAALLAWQVVWSVHALAGKLGLDAVGGLYEALSALALASAGLGALALLRLRREQGRLPARVWLPWAALHAWYVLLYRHPQALFWVQVSHALQYLPFPLRVEANRAAEAAGSLGSWARRYALHVAAGFAAFWALPHLVWGLPAAVLIVDALQIHHYFVDGCIWKLGDPDVRRDLFRHLGAEPVSALALEPAPASAQRPALASRPMRQAA